MHPAPSVIVFSSISGLGFGLLVFLGLGMPNVTGLVAFVFFVIAYALSVGGLIASTFHLGHPERALLAFTQWRSSWLSREAWAAVLALCLMALNGFGKVFLASSWEILGWLGAALSVLTVLCTAMIYAQLSTIPRWNSWTVPMMFVGYCLGGGALLAGQISIALPLLIIAGLGQAAHWVLGDRALARSGTTQGTATGLGAGAEISVFERPHTGPNYLTREFMFTVGRKHVQKLRIIGFSLAIIIPVICLLLPFSHILAAIAVIAHLAGVLVTRWLFFAQAEHVVGLYYGAR